MDVGALIAPILRYVRIVEPGDSLGRFRCIGSITTIRIRAGLLTVAIAFKLCHQVLIKRGQDPVIYFDRALSGYLRAAHINDYGFDTFERIEDYGIFVILSLLLHHHALFLLHLAII